MQNNNNILYEYMLAFLVFIVFVFMILNINDRQDISTFDSVVIENHEYFKCRTYGGYFILTHKANCKYCEKGLRKYTKTIKEDQILSNETTENSAV